MAALTESKSRKYISNAASFIRNFAVAANTTIYEGGMVCVNASGYLVPAADTANFRFIGVANETVDNSTGSNGDLNCAVRINTVEWVTKSSPVVADLGKVCSATDDDTVAVAVGTNVKGIGIAVDYSSTEILVAFDISIQETLT